MARQPEFVDIRRSMARLYDGYNEENLRREDCRSKEEFIKKLKSTGELNAYFDRHDISEKLESLFRGFIDMMNKKELQPYKYYRKYCLSGFNDFTRCYKKYEYEFGAYLNEDNEITEADSKSFRDFPLMFKKLCVRYGIEPYASMTSDELHIFLQDYVDTADRQLVIPAPPNRNRSDLSEELIQYTYEKFNKNKAKIVTQFGDGYGFEIINRDKTKKKETLVTVKTGYSDNTFDLTRLEYKVMRDAASLPNTSYLICSYNCTTKWGEIRVNEHHVYRYDIKNNILVDVKDPSSICILEPYFDYAREGRYAKIPRVKFKCIPQKRKVKKFLFINSSN